MDVADLIRKGHPVVLKLLIFFSIVELGISAFLVSQFNQYGDYASVAERDRTVFLLFASVWTILLSALFMLAFFRMPDGFINSVGSHFCYFLLTWIFWTAGAGSIITALGGDLGTPDCGDGTVFFYCVHLGALKVVAELIWALVTLALIVVIVRGAIAAFSHWSNSDSERASV